MGRWWPSTRRCSPRPPPPTAPPYEEGWLRGIQPTSLRKNLKNLFFDAETLRWIDEDASCLGAMLGVDSQYPLTAAGGEALSDIYGSAPEFGWDRLAQAFLR
jgi:hypothetical protein